MDSLLKIQQELDKLEVRTKEIESLLAENTFFMQRFREENFPLLKDSIISLNEKIDMLLVSRTDEVVAVTKIEARLENLKDRLDNIERNPNQNLSFNKTQEFAKTAGFGAGAGTIVVAIIEGIRLFLTNGLTGG